MGFQVLEDRVVVKRDVAEKVSQGGLHLPEGSSAVEKPRKGTVVLVGPGVWKDGKFHEMTLKTGDRIIFGKYAGAKLELRPGEEYDVMRLGDVIGVFVEEGARAALSVAEDPENLYGEGGRGRS